jgi:hypothetical protein
MSVPPFTQSKQWFGRAGMRFPSSAGARREIGTNSELTRAVTSCPLAMFLTDREVLR